MMATKVFISYRRDDSAGHAGRVHDRLEREFGRDLLFMDVDGVPLGVNFVKVLSDEVAKCDVLLAVIGPNWLNARDEDGNRRLDNPHDFVRIEIGAALQRNILVIPILLDSAKVPKANQLPKDLEELSIRNGLDVRHASFHNDIDRLVRSLKGQLAEAEAEKRRCDEDERGRQEAEIKQRADEEERRRKAEAEGRRRDEDERRRQEAENKQQADEEEGRRKTEAEERRRAEEERRRQEKPQAEARQRAEEEHRRQEAQTKRRLDEAEAEKRRQDKERRKPEKEAAWAAKKERLHRWRGAAAGAAVVALLMVGGIWLYRTTTPAGVTSAVVHPDASGADTAKAAADAEAKRKAEEAEQQRLAAAKAEEERKAGTQAATRPKIMDRIEPGSPQTRAAPAPATQAAVPPAQKVVLYEEDPADPNGKRFVGSAIWRTETVTPGAGQPPEVAIRADVEVPERKLDMTFSLRPNTDKSLSATHTVEFMFKLPADFPSGGISNVPGILAKQAEQTRGTPLAGLAVKVTTGFFLMGLSNADADKYRNLQLLKEMSWFDIPLVYNNNRRAILALEKGTPGERVFADAFKAWKQ
jgi:hypothetical protein